MKKILLATIGLLGSIWFTPVIFVTSTFATMKIICNQNQCERDISSGSSFPKMFYVLVRLPVDNKIESVLLADLNEFISKNPNSSLQLPFDKGVTNDESWEYSVIHEKSGYQLIEAHSSEGARIEVSYRASGQSVQPLSLKVLSQGVLFFAILISGVFTFLLLVKVRRMSKKIR